MITVPLPQKRIVRFDTYCPKCIYWSFNENEDPCDECLCYPGNDDSRQPINYKPKN